MSWKTMLLVWVALLSTTFCGCSRLINSSVSAVGSAPSGGKAVSGPVTYEIINTEGRKEAERAFSDALSAHGISAKAVDSPDSAHLHVIVYLLDPVPGPVDRVMIAPMGVIAFATIGLVPLCLESTYPVEIHALAPSSSGSINRTSSMHAQYTLNECFWLPTILKTAKELDEQKYRGLRQIFDEALQKLPLVPTPI